MKRKATKLFVLVILLVGNLKLSSQNYTMERLPMMHGGNIQSICTHNNLLFAGTITGQVYKSADEGNNWSKCTTPYSGSFNFKINKLFSSGTRLFAATNYGLFYSDDAALSWQYTDILNPVIVNDFFKVGSTLYLITNRKGLMYSINNGSTFQRHPDPVFNNDSDLRFVNIDSTGNIFIGPYTYVGHHIIRTDDQGNSWYSQSVPEIPTGFCKTGNRFVISSYYSAQTTTTTWAEGKPIDLHISDPDSRLYRVMHYRDKVFMYYNRGILISNDSGANFMQSNLIKAVNELSIQFNKLWAATEGGIYFSDDMGITWIQSDQGIEEAEVIGHVQISDHTSNIIATKNHGIFLLKNSTFVKLDSVPLENEITAISHDNSNRTFLLANGTEIYQTQPDKFNFHLIASLRHHIGKANQMLYYNGKFYFSDNAQSLYVTDSVFTDFTKVTAVPTAEHLFANGVLFVVSQDGIYSTQDGINWSKKYIPKKSFSYYGGISSDCNGHFSIIANNQIYYSLDGNTWNATVLTGAPIKGCLNLFQYTFTGAGNRILRIEDGVKTLLSNPLYFETLPNISLVPQPLNDGFEPRFFFLGMKQGDGIWRFNVILGENDPKRNETLSVFPNPILDHFYISGYRSDIDFQLMDSQGKLILTGKTNGIKTLVNVVQLSKGVYYLNLDGYHLKLLK